MIKIDIDLFINSSEEPLDNEIKTKIDKLNNLLHLNKGKKNKHQYQKKTVINVSNKSLIKECLNKITNETYDTHIETLINLINDYDDKKTIAEDILNICKYNIFYSELYSRLYYELIINKQLLIFKEILDNKKEEIINLYNNIEYIDAEINYDKFCKNNKLNEMIRSETTFYSYLYMKTLIDDNFIVKLIFFLFDKIKTEENDKNIFEYIENIKIIMTITNEKIKQNDKFQEIVSLLNKIKTKSEHFKHIKNKTLFKCMDILDIIN